MANEDSTAPLSTALTISDAPITRTLDADYQAVMGIPLDASRAEIKAAYKKYTQRNANNFT